MLGDMNVQIGNTKIMKTERVGLSAVDNRRKPTDFCVFNNIRIIVSLGTETLCHGK
jgi:hypothetical protein